MPSNDSTPNYNLVLPYGGRHNWTDLANGNFRLIDALIATFVSITDFHGLWTNNTDFSIGDNVADQASGVIYTAQVDHVSASAPTTFAEDRAANPTYWLPFASPARNRGAWVTSTAYSLNDFVVSGSKYAVCVVSHTSSATFEDDEALGRWSVLVDLSAAGSLVLPILTGASDASKLVTTNSAGDAYVVSAVLNALAAGGASATGLDILQIASAAALRTLLGMGTAALADTGTSIGNVLVFTEAGKLPVLDGSNLTGVAAPGVASSTTFLGVDVNLSNTGTFFTGPEISIGTALITGTWVIYGNALLTDTAGAANFELCIYDLTGAAYKTNTAVSISAANLNANASTMWIQTFTGVRNFQLRAKDGTSTSGKMLSGSGGSGVANKATSLVAWRIA